jgi:hypothetical protein
LHSAQSDAVLQTAQVAAAQIAAALAAAEAAAAAAAAAPPGPVKAESSTEREKFINRQLVPFTTGSFVKDNSIRPWRHCS